MEMETAREVGDAPATDGATATEGSSRDFNAKKTPLLAGTGASNGAAAADAKAEVGGEGAGAKRVPSPRSQRISEARRARNEAVAHAHAAARRTGRPKASDLDLLRRKRAETNGEVWPLERDEWFTGLGAQQDTTESVRSAAAAAAEATTQNQAGGKGWKALAQNLAIVALLCALALFATTELELRQQLVAASKSELAATKSAIQQLTVATKSEFELRQQLTAAKKSELELLTASKKAFNRLSDLFDETDAQLTQALREKEQAEKLVEELKSEKNQLQQHTATQQQQLDDTKAQLKRVGREKKKAKELAVAKSWEAKSGVWETKFFQNKRWFLAYSAKLIKQAKIYNARNAKCRDEASALRTKVGGMRIDHRRELRVQKNALRNEQATSADLKSQNQGLEAENDRLKDEVRMCEESSIAANVAKAFAACSFVKMWNSGPKNE